MRCSVVFGVTSSLLVINISSSSPTINTAAYYQRCVITCETVAVVHRRPCWQHLACCSANSRHSSEIGSESRFLPTPPAFYAPVRGLPSEYCYAVWHRNTGVVWLLDGEKISKMSLFDLTWSTNVTHTQTDRQTDTAWRHRPRLCIASRGNNGCWKMCWMSERSSVDDISNKQW